VKWEPVALHADEGRLLGEWDASRVVLGKQRRERGVDRDCPLPSALRLAHPEQSAREVDVVPVEPEQLAPAQSAVGHHGEQQPVALGLTAKVPLPQLGAGGLSEQPLELAHRQHVGKRLALLRRPQR